MIKLLTLMLKLILKFMKKLVVLFTILFLISSCKNDSKADTPDIQTKTEKPEFSIIIHGGAGYITKENLSPEKEAEYQKKLEEAIRVGYNILKNGGSSLDAVQKTINILEDSPLFNAGRGAVFTYAGENEHDASIMDGKTLNAGASAGTKTIKNPINLARAVMEKSPHVMLSGSGAEEFAKERDAAEKQYKPDMGEILFFTPLLNPGDEFKLRFKVPDQPGDYPYVCTFPGHWQSMNGIIKVRAKVL